MFPPIFLVSTSSTRYLWQNHPAVYVQGLTGHVIAVVTEQKNNSFGHIGGLARMPDRKRPAHCLKGITTMVTQYPFSRG